MAALVKLLGDKLTLHGQDLDVASLATSHKYIGLYFSAHWCGPCRGFTPELAKSYKDLKDKGLEIVFVSSDRDAAGFETYHKEQPWPALPYADRNRKNKLSAKFKVQGIPTLCILDAATAELITDSGRSAFMGDRKGEQLPWPKPNALDVLRKAPLIDNKKNKMALNDIVGQADVVGLYFSAHWCGPCKAFTPKFAATYAKLKADDEKAGRPQRFAVVFVSADRDEESFTHYLASMPWHAVDEHSGEVNDALSQLFGVDGIPTLILLDKKGNVLSDEGVGAVASDATGDDFPWQPRAVNVLNQATASLIQGPALFAFADDNAKAKALASALAPKAEAWRNEAAPEFFAGADTIAFFTCGTDPLADRIRALSGSAAKGAALVILDLQQQLVYVPENDSANVSESAVKAFAQDFAAGKYKAAGKPMNRA